MVQECNPETNRPFGPDCFELSARWMTCTMGLLMDLRRVGIVYRKEILEALRDRRTIISTIAIPIILFPLIFVLFGGLASVMVKSAQSERSKIAIIGAEHAPEVAEKIRKSFASTI